LPSDCRMHAHTVTFDKDHEAARAGFSHTSCYFLVLRLCCCQRSRPTAFFHAYEMGGGGGGAPSPSPVLSSCHRVCGSHTAHALMVEALSPSETLHCTALHPRRQPSSHSPPENLRSCTWSSALHCAADWQRTLGYVCGRRDTNRTL
jgi:hypothetical protein